MARSGAVEKTLHIPAEYAQRLQDMAEARRVSEDEIVERALEILFSLTESVDSDAERRGWSALAEDSLSRVWDNADDARYDDWARLYGVAAG